MARPRLPHLPFAPLEAFAGLHGDPLRRNSQPDPVATAARAFGVTQRTVHRWLLDGVPLREADRACCRIGLVPGMVWGDAYHDAEDRGAREVRERAAHMKREREWREVMRSWWQWSEQHYRREEA